MTSLGEEFDTTLPRNGRRNGSDVRTIASWLLVGSTIVGLIFAAGYNWRRIEDVAAAQEKEAAYSEQTYLRKDVQQQHDMTVDNKFDELKAQLVDIRRAIDRRNDR